MVALVKNSKIAGMTEIVTSIVDLQKSLYFGYLEYETSYASTME